MTGGVTKFGPLHTTSNIMQYRQKTHGNKTITEQSCQFPLEKKTAFSFSLHHQSLGGKQNVASSKIAVDKSFLLDVTHAASNLRCPQEQVHANWHLLSVVQQVIQQRTQRQKFLYLTETQTYKTLLLTSHTFLLFAGANVTFTRWHTSTASISS